MTRSVRLASWGALGVALLASTFVVAQPAEPPHSAALDRMIVQQARKHGVPEKLVRRVVMRESRYNPSARNHKYWGLMQISYPTAKSMGFNGTPQELLNPLVNLTYAVPYLANAFIIAGKREDAAVRLYAAGYYDTAKRRGLLGALRTAASAPMVAQPEETEVAAVGPAQNYGLFGSLVGAAQPAQATATPASEASAAPPTPQPESAVAPRVAANAAGMNKSQPGDASDMIPNKRGDLEPPKKWQRDGGMTVIARGEQSIEAVSAHEQANDGPKTPTRRKVARGLPRKNTAFASLETTPASAQAYSAVAAAPQPEPQAAISQATAAQPSIPASETVVQAPSTVVDDRAAAAQTATAEARGSDNAGAESPATIRKKRSAHKSRRHADTKTRLAKTTTDTPAVEVQRSEDDRPQR